MATFKYSDITEKIIGAAFRVHGTLGNGFQEVIYQRAMELELNSIKMDFVREFEMPIHYLDQQIGTRRVDFLIENIISVELKAIINLEDVHVAQALNYLEAYNLEVGLLINFGSKKLEFNRFTNKKYDPGVIHHPKIPNHPKNPSSDNHPKIPNYPINPSSDNHPKIPYHPINPSSDNPPTNPG